MLLSCATSRRNALVEQGGRGAEGQKGMGEKAFEFSPLCSLLLCLGFLSPCSLAQSPAPSRTTRAMFDTSSSPKPRLTKPVSICST